MDVIDELFKFEEKYPFLYDEIVGDVAVYTCLRDDVAARLVGQALNQAVNVTPEKGRIYFRRIIDTFIKWRKNHRRKTLIFTSSVYRRDYGRNLSVEFLMQRYPDAVCFEWPSRNDTFDRAYFSDKVNYIPLDGYVALFKIYTKLHRKELQNIEATCRNRLITQFLNTTPNSDGERDAIAYLMDALPKSVATTFISQRLFRWMFHNFHNVQFAIDYWGSARENIVPVLPGKPQSVELQHGIITPQHPGYIYPQFVCNVASSLFYRKILVFSATEQNILTQKSIYSSEQIEVVGNPRIQMYKKIAKEEKKDRRLILFTSQPYEQDLPGCSYYTQMLPYLKRLQELINRDGRFTFAIKLHPRENDAVKMRYIEELPGVQIHGSSSQLYELLSESCLHITATSTTLFEALEFDVPTITVQFDDFDPKIIYGIATVHITNPSQFEKIWINLCNRNWCYNYLERLKKQLK